MATQELTLDDSLLYYNASTMLLLFVLGLCATMLGVFVVSAGKTRHAPLAEIGGRRSTLHLTWPTDLS